MVLMVIGALIAVETSDLLSSVISVAGVGILLSVVFLFLHAPDIAITQVVVEILVLVILIRSTIARDLYTNAMETELFSVTISIALILLLGLFARQMIATLAFGTPAMVAWPNAASLTYIRDGLTLTGAGNIVAAVILDFRAYDTLGEAIVLFLSILGAMVIMRGRTHKRIEERVPDYLASGTYSAEQDGKKADI